MKNINVPIKFGIGIAIGLIVYFLIISIFGAHTNPFFSLFNPVIVGGGMFAAINYYKKERGNKFKYQKGFRTGVVTGFIATILFTIFFAFYATEIEPDFIERLLGNWGSDWYINIGMVIFTVALMGFATTVVLTLTFMQIFKDSWNTKEGKEHEL
ncbi:hypothetical protein BH23BAC2_BH23BAC2_04790 [soil metagenome]